MIAATFFEISHEKCECKQKTLRSKRSKDLIWQASKGILAVYTRSPCGKGWPERPPGLQRGEPTPLMKLKHHVTVIFKLFLARMQV